MKRKNLVHDFNQKFKTFQEHILEYNAHYTSIESRSKYTKTNAEAFCENMSVIQSNIKQTTRAYNKILQCIPYCSDASAWEFMAPKIEFNYNFSNIQTKYRNLYNYT